MTSRTPFSDADAAAAWNEAAGAWDDFVESGADYYRHEVHGPALLAACEPLRGQRALDLGCGQGYFSRQMARRGANVVGIDIAAELLVFAQKREAGEPLGIDYRQLSAADVGDSWSTDTFDIVAACMSLQDMADVEKALRGAAWVLRPGGRLVFSVPHPGSETPFREWERDPMGRKRCLKLDRYFDTGPAECRWDMPRLKYHWSTPHWRHTLSEWAKLIVEAGFLLDYLDEPRATEEQVAANPRLDGCRRMPLFLIFGARKMAGMPLGRN